MNLEFFLAALVIFVCGIGAISWKISMIVEEKIKECELILFLFFEELEKTKRKVLKKLRLKTTETEEKIKKEIEAIETRLERWEFEKEKKSFFSRIFSFFEISRKEKLLENELKKELRDFERFADELVEKANKSINDEIVFLNEKIDKLTTAVEKMKKKLASEKSFFYIDVAIKKLEEAKQDCRIAFEEKGERLALILNKIKKKLERSVEMMVLANKKKENEISVEINVSNLEKIERDFEEWIKRLKNSDVAKNFEFKSFVAACEFFLKKFKYRADLSERRKMAKQISEIATETIDDEHLRLVFADFDLFKTTFLRKLEESDISLGVDDIEIFNEKFSNILNLEEFKKRIRFVKKALSLSKFI